MNAKALCVSTAYHRRETWACKPQGIKADVTCRAQSLYCAASVSNQSKVDFESSYCRTAQAFAEKEEFRILFLDKRNALIADEVQGSGTVDHTPVYPREVVKRALELSATAIILVHNHPSGDPTPSRADIDMTKAIVDIARPLGISVHDHIIVGKHGHASLKGLRLM